MIDGLTFEHIGIATQNLAETAKMYVGAGFSQSEVVADKIQNTNICFLTKDGHPKIELVEPIDVQSSINKMLKKNRGICPYHICYQTDDINSAYEILTEKMGYIPLFRLVEAIAFQNRLICYLFHPAVGYVELVNKQ